MKFTDPEFRRFVVAGAFNTLLGYILYLAFIRVLDYRAAFTASYALGIVISFAINTWFVFRQPWSWRKLAAFPLVYLVQYLLGLTLLWLFVSRLGWSERIAPLLTIPLTIPVTFALSRLIVKGPARDPEPH